MDRPLVHLLPHWNFQGREGELIRVFAYTNCEELELYLNGESLGRQKIERFGHGEWMVPYRPGKLTVEGRDGGKTLCRDSRETTGEAKHLKLRLENKVAANGRDMAVITCYCTDAEGREVPTASPEVAFFTNGLGRVVGTGSDITDHRPVFLPDRKMRAGRITAAIQVGTEIGELKVYAQSPGLTDACLTILLGKERSSKERNFE